MRTTNNKKQKDTAKLRLWTPSIGSNELQCLFSLCHSLVSVWNMTVMSWAASQRLTQRLDPHEKVRTDELMRSRISLLSVWPQGLLTIWWPFMNLLWIYWSECVWNFEMTPRVILVSLRLQLDQCASVMTPTNMWWRFYDVHAFTRHRLYKLVH